MKRHLPDTPDIIDSGVLGQMLEATAAPLTPPSELRARILTRVRAHHERCFTVRGDNTQWRALSPGVEFKLLWFDAHICVKSFLLRAAAGSRFPRHDHHGFEECLVLEGEFAIGQLPLGAGDFHGVSTQAVHEDAYTENGFLIYLRTHIDDHPDVRP